ncbi:MAG: ribonuclease III family protein [Candidatus Hodarchaeota archaeon]
MPYDFLIKDLTSKSSQKAIGTDKGLAKIGDGIVNFVYSVAKSSYLTENSANNKIIRTGKKVNRTILSNALKNANLKICAKSRADAHDLADTAEALIAYVWLSGNLSIDSMIEIILTNFSGDLNIRVEELQNATLAFTKLLESIKKYIPQSKV